MTHRNVAFSLCHSPGLASASWAAGLVPGYRAGVWQQAQSLGDLEDMHTHVMGSQHQQDGLEEKGGELGCWLAQHRSPTQMCPSLEYIQSKIPNNGFQDTSVWTGLSFPSLDTSQELFWGTDGEPQDLQPVATGVAGKAQVGLG